LVCDVRRSQPWKFRSGVGGKSHSNNANTFIEPESYSRAFGLAYRTLLPLISKRASRVATVSQFSADMLVKFGVCRREKIFIAPNGHEHALRWDASRAAIPRLKVLKRPYVLLLGSSSKHKNVHVVLEQAQGLDAAGIDIVVVGAASSIFLRMRPAISDPTFITPAMLAMTFGIPPLEAMARGCPVISSNAASLIEVGGDAVAYVDPDYGDGWRDAIIGSAGNQDLRATMAAQGRKRAVLFSWKRSAQFYLGEILRLGDKCGKSG
jgi:glycosyltransferase involved in cell wall biosynthesis